MRLKSLSRTRFLSFVIALIAVTLSPLPARSQKPHDDDSTGVARKSKNTHHKAGDPNVAAAPDDRDGVDIDDPAARYEWQRQVYGVPDGEYRRKSMAEARRHNQRTGRSSFNSGTQTNNAADVAGTQTLLGPIASGPAWLSIGPTGANWEQNGSFTGLVRDSGRARAILPHPTDPDTLYFLTSGGGLWKTTNFTSADTVWTPLTDNLPTVAGGSVTFGRDPNTLYLGLGDPFDLILIGGAVVKSTDGGNTWSSLVELGDAVAVMDIKVDTSTPQDIVLVGTELGLFRSTDGGTTFSQIQGASGQQFFQKSIWSIVRTSAGWLLDAQSCPPGRATRSCGQLGGLYLSTDLGATWSAIGSTTGFADTGRTTLAVAAPGESIVYAIASAGSGTSVDTTQKDLFKSTDGGLTWTALGVNSTKAPLNPNGYNPDMNLLHTQAWYNQMILVDPNDATRNTVYLGGDLSTAKTINGGSTWTLLSNWLYGFAGLPYVHADCHAAAFSSASNSLLFGSDGGLFISKDNGATWNSDKNNGLVTHLFYSIAGSPQLPNMVYGGLQDNGTRVRSGNSTIYNQSLGGDGLGAAMSQANTDTALLSSQSSAIRRDHSRVEPELNRQLLSATSGITTSEAGFSTNLVAAASALDPSGRTFFTFTNTRIYKTINGGGAWTIIGQSTTAATTTPGLTTGRTFRSTPYNLGVSPFDLKRVGVGAASGFFVYTLNGGTSWGEVSLNSLIPGFLNTSGVTWADNDNVFVTSVTQTANAPRVAKGTWNGSAFTWAKKQNGLPDLPVAKLIVDPRDSTHNTLLAATHVGVYRTTDGGENWAPYGTGLPNVRVADMYMPPDGGSLRIATYGRGIWEMPQIEFVSAQLTDDGNSCDHDGWLDNNESGHLTITLHNQGSTTLSGISATITSSNAHVSFPSGNIVSFPSANGYSDVTTTIPVALVGASGIEQADFAISFGDPSLGLPGPVNVTSTQRVNVDELANVSAVETFEENTSGWTVGGTPESLPDKGTWHRFQYSPTDRKWNGGDSNGSSDVTLTSPIIHLGAAPVAFSFEHRFSFEATACGTPLHNCYWDGGIVEISTDNGGSWTNLAPYATFNGPFATFEPSNNVITGQLGWGNRYTSFPDFATSIITLGTAFANQDIRIRFRVASDSATGGFGWDIDNITFSGAGTPFAGLVAHNPVCGTSLGIASSANPSLFGQPVTFSAGITGGVTPAGGTMTFSDGGTAIGSSAVVNGLAQFTTSALALGSHNISAAYSGDGGHAASSSDTLVQVVNQASTTLVVTSSHNPGVKDEVLTFTATAVPVAPASGTPTGTVQFTIDGVAYGAPVGLAGGAASVTTAFREIATHTVSAVYSGDTNFGGSAGELAGGEVVQRAYATVHSEITSITRNGAGQYVVTLTVSNSGTISATNVTITKAKIGNKSAAVPVSLGTIGVGGTTTVTLVFPASAGSAGSNAAVQIGGTSTSGGNFEDITPVILP